MRYPNIVFEILLSNLDLLIEVNIVQAFIATSSHFTWKYNALHGLLNKKVMFFQLSIFPYRYFVQCAQNQPTMSV